MTISRTLIGTCSSSGIAVNGTITIPFTGTVPAGATIVVAGIWWGGASITDGANTYAGIEGTASNGNSWSYGIWSATNVVSRNSSNSITIKNVGGFSAPFAMQAFYLTSSTNAEILYDTNASAQSGGGIQGSSVTLTSGSPANSNEFFVGGTIGAFTGKTISFSTGWTQAGSTITQGSGELAVATFQQSGSGTVTFNPSTNASENWNIVLVGFYEHAVGTSGTWASTDAKDTFSVHGGLIGGTWTSTETKDTFRAIVDPITGIWGSTETPDTFYAKAYEVDGVIIQSMFFPLSMTMTVTEIIPIRITTNLPLFSQVMEVEEVPATYFVTAAVTTTLKGFGQEATVHITLPDAVSVAEMNPPGRGGGGALPTISTERELLDLFGGHAFNRGVDAVVPSTRVAASNLTTTFSPKSVVRPPMPPPSPRRRK